MKSERLDEMKTEAPKSTMSGASLEEMLGKHPRSLMEWTNAKTDRRENTRRAARREIVMQGVSVRVPEPR